MLAPGKVKVAVATVVKAHGIHGELNVTLGEMAEPDSDFAPGACLIAELEGLDVPFFVKSARSRGSESYLLQLDEVDSDTAAARMQGHVLYVYADPSELNADVFDEGMSAGALVGYEVTNAHTGASAGRIETLTELTPGCWYFVMEQTGKLIPAVDDLIAGIDPDRRCVEMLLPEGLTEL